jgi:hypothetical protein
LHHQHLRFVLLIPVPIQVLALILVLAQLLVLTLVPVLTPIPPLILLPILTLVQSTLILSIPILILIDLILKSLPLLILDSPSFLIAHPFPLTIQLLQVPVFLLQLIFIPQLLLRSFSHLLLPSSYPSLLWDQSIDLLVMWSLAPFSFLLYFMLLYFMLVVIY